MTTQSHVYKQDDALKVPAPSHQMREAFERHYRMNVDPTRMLWKRGGSAFAEDVPESDYVDGGIQRRWIEWQAAWAAAILALPEPESNP